jgi:hypothetical protein
MRLHDRLHTKRDEEKIGVCIDSGKKESLHAACIPLDLLIKTIRPCHQSNDYLSI